MGRKGKNRASHAVYYKKCHLEAAALLLLQRLFGLGLTEFFTVEISDLHVCPNPMPMPMPLLDLDSSFSFF